MEIKDILQIVSTLIAAGSVLFAIYTYKRSRLVQQITAIRGAVGDAIRVVTKLDELLSEAAATQMGFCVARELREVFGNSTAPEELSRLLADEDNYNLILRAIYRGADSTDVLEIIDISVEKFTQLTVSLRSLSPATSMIITRSSEVLIASVYTAYATGQLKQVFDDGPNRKVTLSSVLKQPSPEMAYADVGDSVAAAIGFIIRNRQQAIFDQAEIVVNAVLTKLMAMSDPEMIAFFKRDQSLGAPISSVRALDDQISDLNRYLDLTASLFPQVERDPMLRAASQLQVLNKARQVVPDLS